MKLMRFLLLFLLWPLAGLSQPKGWQELTIADGLSQGMIFDVEQDRNGFMWVATKDGLNRYDGYNFTVFTHDPYNEYSISDNYCTALLIDSRQRLWVGTASQGLNLYDDRTQRFYHVDISDQAKPNAGNYEIRLLKEDPDGNIWVGTNQNKLFKVSIPAAFDNELPGQANFTAQVRIWPLALPVRGPDNVFHFISFRPDGQGMVGSTYGVYTLNWRRASELTASTPVRNEVAYSSAYGDAGKGWWAGAGTDRVFLNWKGKQKSIFLAKARNTGFCLKLIDSTTLAIANVDYLWLMSPDDLFRQDSLTEKNAVTAMPAQVYAVTDLIKDRTGIIWVGTSGYGLRLFNTHVRQFHTYLPGQTLSYLLPDRQGRVYVRYQFSYGLLDRARNRLVPFLSPALPEADRRQRYLMQDRKGFFWGSNVHFETHVQHLFKFSTDWQLLRRYPLPPNTSFGFYNNQTIEDKLGYLWIGATNGKLLRFNPTTEAFQVFSYESLLPRSGADIEVNALYIDRAGTLWIGTQQGLVLVRNLHKNPRFSIYKNNRLNRRSLSHDVVSSLIDDPHEPDRYLWVGTKGGGLERLDKQAGQFTHFTEAQGLPNKVIYGLQTDEFRNLWISTNRGIACFNPKTLRSRNYTRADGLQDNEFNSGSFAKLSRNELLFGGVNGLTSFQASQVIRMAGRRPIANIIGLRINNQPIEVGASDGILPESIEHRHELELSHEQNLLTLEFGVMDYTNASQNRYRYQLSNLDRNWVEAGTNRFANYARLPAGRYTLRMMGSPDGEIWSKPVELVIHIAPPFYQTWWAYLAYLLVIVGVGWQLYRFQTQRLLLQQRLVFERKEASRLVELDALKTKFFTNISHEFRTPLTLILGPIEQVMQQYPQDKRFPLIQRNASRLLSLINQLLDLSKLETGQLRLEAEPGDLVAFFQSLVGSFGALAQSRQVRLVFSQNEPAYRAVFDPDKLEKIVTNLLGNAIKFTPAGQEIRLLVSYPPPEKPGMLRITVQDTGIGIAPADLPHIFERFYQADDKVGAGSGIGLALVNELVRVLQGTIEVNSTEGVGTTFTVQLPVTSAVESVERTAASGLPATTTVAHRPNGKVPPEAMASTLLIIDDNEDIRAYVKSIFTADFQVIEAVDGVDGLEKATHLLPTVVICDLMMPQLNGFDFCRALKSQEATSHIPVLILTAKATVEDRIESYEGGADAYLTKPFNPTEIEVVVRNLIQQRERLYRSFAQTGQLVDDEITDVPLTAEQRFIDRLTDIVRQNLEDPSFTVESLADAANLSRVQLYRKLKALTNKTATQFIREIRLIKAAELLRTGDETVTQVAYAVGFDNLSYFAKVFQEHYGILPSQYGRNKSSALNQEPSNSQ